MVPEPDGEIAAAYEIRLFIDKISRVPGNIGISDVDTTTVESEPNRMYARLVVVLVTTTESPPPDRATFEETAPAETPTVPVGRNGLMEPIGMVNTPRQRSQPICSTITARL
jgi:hypothetical protein